jgi:hypothetical protein
MLANAQLARVAGFRTVAVCVRLYGDTALAPCFWHADMGCLTSAQELAALSIAAPRFEGAVGAAARAGARRKHPTSLKW